MTTAHGSVAGRFVSSAGARLIVLPVTGACSLLTAHAISGGYGRTAYALFSLVATLPFLFPTADLGLGAALMTAAARLPGEQDAFADVYRRVTRILRIAGGTAALISLGVGALGAWGRIIGTDRTDLGWPVAIALAWFALSIAWSSGASVLIGLGRNHVVSYLQSIVPVATYAVAGLGALLGGPLPLLIALCTIGLPLSSLICVVVARRDPNVRRALTRHERPHAPDRVLAVAAPMLVIIVTSALTIQPGRLILSHLSSVAQVAALTAAYSLFLPLLSVMQTAGRSFWPAFARARSHGEDLSPIVRLGLRLTTVIGVGGAIGLIVFGPPVARWSTHGLVATPIALYAVLGLAVLVVAVHQVSAMFLNDARGLKFQSATSVGAMAGSLAIAISLAVHLGALGVAIGLLAGFTLGQALPCLVRARQTLRAARVVTAR